jgi:hypothetical protein
MPIQSEIDRSDKPVTVVFVTNGSEFKIRVSSQSIGLSSQNFSEKSDNFFRMIGRQALFSVNCRES